MAAGALISEHIAVNDFDVSSERMPRSTTRWGSLPGNNHCERARCEAGMTESPQHLQRLVTLGVAGGRGQTEVDRFSLDLADWML
jgi:hypothetical protein